MRIYFASDIHLGAPTVGNRRLQEKRFVNWLNSIRNQADAIYLLGDIFDYWFEYKSVVPRGYVRLLAKLCELQESGVEIHIFTGNHDVWMFSYLQEECGLIVHNEPYETTFYGKRFLIAHGDGLGGYDKGYSILKWIFRCRPIQIIYSWLHPDIANFIATTWSALSRKSHKNKSYQHSFMGEEKELQIRYVKALEESQAGKVHDFYIFGHRHIIADFHTKYGAHVDIIGDWLFNFTYAMFDGNEVRIFAVNPDNVAESKDITEEKRYEQYQ